MAASKAKGKSRETRRSRSRNTTPSSGLSADTSVSAPTSSYLDNDVSKLLMPTTVQYADLLESVGAAGPIPDSRSLESLTEHLKTLSELAEARGEACNAGMRELHERWKDVIGEEPYDRAKMKHEVEDDDDECPTSKGGKFKKRKDRGSVKKDRPLALGAHELARQDGAETKVEGAASPASKRLKQEASESTSSLSPASLASPQPPHTGDGVPDELLTPDDRSDSLQPDPAHSVPQIQVFGPNPLTFDDPTIYHIREVAPDMTDEERKEIYSVSQFPKSDLRHMMAGTLPDRDFSNAKPSNQVSANSFLSYIDPFVRPLTEEDMAFLKEKGDRTTPFIMPRRGKRHYTEIWAEEDGLTVDQFNNDRERLPLNQGRGNVDQVTDDTAETDKVSVAPLLSRLYALLRYEHRADPDDNPSSGPAANGSGTTANGDAASSNLFDGMDLDHPNGESETKPLPAATSFPDASPSGFKVATAKLDHAQLDERLKAELRHIGFLGPEDNPDYDAHYDDDIAQRLRLLQSELKKQMITNCARKARLLEIARERMAFQEYMTIHEDLDSQVQQAYLKRTRTLGKTKKGWQAKHKPGGAGGGSHVASTVGVSRQAIGDVARTLMDRRKRWHDCIGPIFKDSKTTVPGKGESIFEPSVLAEYEKAELEGWDEEQE